MDDAIRQRYAEAGEAAHRAWVDKHYNDRRSLGDFLAEGFSAVRDAELATLRRTHKIQRDQIRAYVRAHQKDAAKWSQDLEKARAEVRDYENRITWFTTCKGCAAALDSSYAETVRAEKAEAALAEATAKLDRLTTRGQIAGEEIELANRRLDLFQREMNEQREIIADQRRVNGEAITRAEKAEDAISRVREVHDVHSCDRDGHIHRSTPNPCVNDGFCSCGRRSPCPTLEALDSPKDATS